MNDAFDSLMQNAVSSDREALVNATVDAIVASDDWPRFVVYDGERIYDCHFREAEGLILGITEERDGTWEKEHRLDFGDNKIHAIDDETGEVYRVMTFYIPVADDTLYEICNMLFRRFGGNAEIAKKLKSVNED